ncbi:endonuclease domain-containing protein [Streptomyces bobili]|uniref:endonuclease domain-containing protein n=1 Tax=Streptomyces bobili TaxID=67280 RepID=UPI00338F0F98
MAEHTRPRGRPCSHRVYQLDCDDYDRLVRHAAGRCQICAVPPEQTKHGFLVIDHDDAVGQWAVRGLLCSNCNTGLPTGSMPAHATAYLTQPWWRSEAERRGQDTAPWPEPPSGSVVAACRGLRWHREGDSWRHVAKYRGAPRSWWWLQRHYGPHNMRLVKSSEEKTA